MKNITLEEIKTRVEKMDFRMLLKMKLAYEITKTLRGKDEAKKAQQEWFCRSVLKRLPDGMSPSAGGMTATAPEDIPSYKIKSPLSVMAALVASGLATSKNDARRLIEQGGVKVDGNVVQDVNEKVKAGVVIQKGKRHFVRLVGKRRR